MNLLYTQSKNSVGGRPPNVVCNIEESLYRCPTKGNLAQAKQELIDKGMSPENVEDLTIYLRSMISKIFNDC